LLAAGWLGPQIWGPTVAPVAALMQALSALILAGPIWWAGLKGLLSKPPGSYGTQLVALATLAGFALGDYETAALIPLILELGHYFEEQSVAGVDEAIAGLRKWQQRPARILTEEGEREVPAASLVVGDRVVVRPGDSFPADGEVLFGQSTVDQASLTGESLPEDVRPGSSVFAGTINLSGLLHVRVRQVGEDTTLGKVAAYLEATEGAKTPVILVLERFAQWYVPLMLAAALATGFWTGNWTRAVAVLVVGCPGALILAGPTAMVAALATSSRHGILLKNAKFLETLADVDTVVLDKTGTLTLGRLEVVALRPEPGLSEHELLADALRCATASRHPVCQAVLRARPAETQEILDENFSQQSRDMQQGWQEVFGQGVIYESQEDKTFLGKRGWLSDQGFTMPAAPDHEGPTAWVAHQGPEQQTILGCLLLADQPRPEARAALDALRALGCRRLVLLTGDRSAVGQAVGAELGLDEVIAEALPEQKLAQVEAEKRAGRKVLVVGDGVNDALALSAGDVGIALGAMGSEAALQGADIVLMTNDLGRIPWLIAMSRRTRNVIHQNIFGGTGIALLMLALAATGWVSPLLGAFVHNFGELFVLLNSARLLRGEPLSAVPSASAERAAGSSGTG